MPIDLDGDGRDEVMAGYPMLNADGSARWSFKFAETDMAAVHLDAFRVLRAGPRRQTPVGPDRCGADELAVIDGNGRPIWEFTGDHFESVDVGQNSAPACPASKSRWISIIGRGARPACGWLTERGRQLAEMVTDYSAPPCPRGLDRGRHRRDRHRRRARHIFDGQGRRVADLAVAESDLVIPTRRMPPR